MGMALRLVLRGGDIRDIRSLLTRSSLYAPPVVEIFKPRVGGEEVKVETTPISSVVAIAVLLRGDEVQKRLDHTLTL